MRLSERLFVLILLCYIVPCHNKEASKRKGRHFLALLGYIHGFKIGQELALQHPSFLLSPVIIVPSTSTNQQQSVNIQTSNAHENVQENSGTQTIIPAKLVLNLTSGNDVIFASNEVNDKDELVNITLRQNVILNNISITATTTQLNNQTFTLTSTTERNPVITSLSNGSYTTPVFYNDAVDNLSVTPALSKNQQLPPVSDMRWQHFKSNLSNILSDDTVTIIQENVNGTILNITEITTESSKNNITYGNGLYPNRLNNNTMIDQLSITTNDYTSEESLSNDRWGSPSVNEVTGPKSSGFKPLAGLYYDGFLHRPLKKFGFIPPNYLYH